MSPKAVMTLRHYQPAGQGTVCGATRQVIDNPESFVEFGKFPILRVPTTTDVRKVDCPHCQEWLRKVVRQFP